MSVAPSALNYEITLYHGLTAAAIIYRLFEAMLWNCITLAERGPKARR
jgi:hypothetical protein